MRPRPVLLIGVAGLLGLGCATPLPYYEQSLELNASGTEPWGSPCDNDIWESWETGGTPGRVSAVLEARHYTVPLHGMPALYGPTRWELWGVRLKADGWDQIDMRRDIGPLGNPPVSYRWFVRARTFAADGAERPATAEARADVDSVMAEMGTVFDPRLASVEAQGLSHGSVPEWCRVERKLGNSSRGMLCQGRASIGWFTALPPWAGAPVTTADRITKALEAGGWSVTQAFPPASSGFLEARRARPGGWDIVTVGGGPEDPSGNGVRWWYSVSAASCDSAGGRGPARGDVLAAGDRLLASLREATAGER